MTDEPEDQALHDAAYGQVWQAWGTHPYGWRWRCGACRAQGLVSSRWLAWDTLDGHLDLCPGHELGFPDLG